MARLLSAREAAHRFGVSEDIAQRRARKAFDTGDPGVQRVGRQYTADEAWWQTILSKPSQRGRPRNDKR